MLFHCMCTTVPVFLDAPMYAWRPRNKYCFTLYAPPLRSQNGVPDNFLSFFFLFFSHAKQSLCNTSNRHIGHTVHPDLTIRSFLREVEPPVPFAVTKQCKESFNSSSLEALCHAMRRHQWIVFPALRSSLSQDLHSRDRVVTLDNEWLAIAIHFVCFLLTRFGESAGGEAKSMCSMAFGALIWRVNAHQSPEKSSLATNFPLSEIRDRNFHHTDDEAQDSWCFSLHWHHH